MGAAGAREAGSLVSSGQWLVTQCSDIAPCFTATTPMVLATYIIAAACHPQIEPDESVPGSETLILFRKFALVKSQLLRATCRLKILHLNSVLRN